MAWPKGKPRPNAFKKKVVEESVEYVEPDLPIATRLSEVIAEIKSVLRSYRHDIEIKVVEQANVTTSVELRITFAVR